MDQLQTLNSASPTTDTFFDRLTKGIFGTDANGQANKFDLSKIIKLPEVNVKADNSQLIVIIAAVSALLFFIVKKKR